MPLERRLGKGTVDKATSRVTPAETSRGQPSSWSTSVLNLANRALYPMVPELADQVKSNSVSKLGMALGRLLDYEPVGHGDHTVGYCMPNGVPSVMVGGHYLRSLHGALDMALIDCPECGREVSSHAETCPGCSFPLNAGSRSGAFQTAAGSQKPAWWKVVPPLAGRVLAGALLIVLGQEEDSVGAIVGGLVIGGSAIPAWYRDKIERLKAGRARTSLDERIQDRMAEMDERHREQIARLEQLHTGRVTELEERVEFAERLLTKQREQIGPG